MIHLELSVAPVWSRVTNVRESVVHGASAIGVADDMAYTLGLVASELVENAIKYGQFRDGGPVQLGVRMDACVARVVVTNPLDPSSDHPTRLRAALARVTSAASARDAYVSRVSELLDEPGASAAHSALESGLGILRVAHEAESTVSVRFLDERSVEVTASMRWTDNDGDLVA